MDTAAAVGLALVELLPAMVADGGGVEVIRVNEDSVWVRLIGTCLFCPSRKKSALALEAGLRKKVPQLRSVFVEYPEMERRKVSSLIAIST
jgi:Fe-S cluster biogenesis protein NfuA